MYLHRVKINKFDNKPGHIFHCIAKFPNDWIFILFYLMLKICVGYKKKSNFTSDGTVTHLHLNYSDSKKWGAFLELLTALKGKINTEYHL